MRAIFIFPERMKINMAVYIVMNKVALIIYVSTFVTHEKSLVERYIVNCLERIHSVRFYLLDLNILA